tara:strand:- start:437 stop:1534 length:1098 start_codon:yes stop_codon:yes gene_type:complete
MKVISKTFLMSSLIAFTACKDQVVKENSSKSVTTPSICAKNPYPSPPSVQFSGVSEVITVEQTRLEISWEANDLAKAYLVFLVPDGQRMKLFKTTSSDKTSTWLEGLTPNTTYNIMVKVLDERGLYDLNEKQISVSTKSSPTYINEKSLLFNGMARVGLKGASELIKDQNFTISMWFKTATKASMDSRLITLHKGSYAGTALAIGLKKDHIFLQVEDSLGNTSKVEYQMSYDDSTWHHTSVTYNGKYLAFYVDSTRVNLNEIKISKFGSHPISVGSYTGNKKGYKGLIDEVSIWSTAMSSLSVNRVYNDRVSNNLMTHPRHNSLLVWHRFGDDIKDSEDGLNDQLGNSHGAPLNIRSNDFVEDSP